MKILVTGMSGVGKSTLCNHFKQLGYNSFDLDDIPNLCNLYHANGSKVTVEENRVDLNMLETDYLCDTAALGKHIDAQVGLTFYFGYIDNFTETAKYFNKIILLIITPDENKHRMSVRTTTDFAKDEKTQNELMKFKNEYETTVQQHDAIIIDASRDTAAIAEEVLEKLDI
jgi:dephospho-CoA kinase